MKAVLIDRDGVINVEREGFVTTPQELDIMPQALEAFALLKSRGFAAIVITNQSVVGRKIIDTAQLSRIHEYLCDAVKESGGKIHDLFFCPDAPDHATYRRKPQPGMLIEAMEKYGLKPELTPFIGDATTDMQAAHAAGCPRYLVMTGKGRKALAALPPELKPVTPCDDLLDAARRIVSVS